VTALILAYHSIIGLPSLIVLPSYALLLLLMAFLTQKEKLWIADRVLLILGISALASLSLAKRTCVKIPVIIEDEVLRWRRIISFISNLANRYVLSRAGAIGIPSPLLLKKLIVRHKV
jgi:hypothetical protein